MHCAWAISPTLEVDLIPKMTALCSLPRVLHVVIGFVYEFCDPFSRLDRILQFVKFGFLQASIHNFRILRYVVEQERYCGCHVFPHPARTRSALGIQNACRGRRHKRQCRNDCYSPSSSRRSQRWRHRRRGRLYISIVTTLPGCRCRGGPKHSLTHMAYKSSVRDSDGGPEDHGDVNGPTVGLSGPSPSRQRQGGLRRRRGHWRSEAKRLSKI